MSIPFWSEQDGEGPIFASNVNPWDTVYLGGFPLPGVWKVTGIPTLAVDRKKSKGVDGALITVNGYIPGPIELDGLLWTADQWDAFQDLSPDIWRKPNRKSKLKDLAMRISHPSLDLWGISQCVVVGVQPPAPGPIPQSRTIKIKAIEYVPLEPTNQTKTAKPRENTPLDQHWRADAKNAGNKPPSETDTGPTGAAVERRGGVS